jgi:chromosomal replication initiator protein
MQKSESLTENPKEFWKTVLGEIELNISPMIFKSMVNRTRVEDITGSHVKVLCDDQLVRLNIEKKFRPLIEKAIQKISKQPLKLDISVGRSLIQNTAHQATPQEFGPLFQPQKDQEVVLREKQEKAKLSPKYTFENYIMGKSNQLAYAIATAVAEKPGEQYNPVFIYSGVGLGKTHLIQAIGNQILKTKPGTKVVYTTGEAFTNELIEAIQSGKGGRGKYATNEFRNKFRKADVLLIDDVQFIIGRVGTQEEFFHTFNELHMAQKQIVITSDRPPKDFNNIEARITSRFGSGIIADIQAPDSEMRAAILRNMRDQNNDSIPNNVIDFIAQKIDSNTRELEGAYIQVLTYTRASGLEVTLETAAAALGQSIREKPERSVNINQILKAVCSYYSVKVADLKGKRRTKELVLPRQVTMYLIKEMTGTPFMTIGEFLGGRDHTTIMHGVDKIGGQVSRTGKIKQDVVNVKQMILTE